MDMLHLLLMIALLVSIFFNVVIGMKYSDSAYSECFLERRASAWEANYDAQTKSKVRIKDEVKAGLLEMTEAMKKINDALNT